MLDKNQKKVMKYIKDHNIPLVEHNVILVGVQESCDMAIVELNNHCLMMGNDWDFHPGCHGMKVPDFSSYDELSLLFQNALVANGNEVEIIVDDTWKYEDDEDE